MRGTRIVMARIIAVLGLVLMAGAAQAADMMYAPAMRHSPCADAGILSEIKARFAFAERTNWHRGYVIAEIGNARPSVHPYAAPGVIRRDYCVADSVMTNGDPRTVYYAIEHGQGFAGIGGRYVDFCVLGLDPWRVHDGACRTVQ